WARPELATTGQRRATGVLRHPSRSTLQFGAQRWRDTIKIVKRNLLFRLERLEARTQVRESTIFRYGWVTRLPEDFTGERHTVIVTREATGSSNTEWCHFEERPGPALP